MRILKRIAVDDDEVRMVLHCKCTAVFDAQHIGEQFANNANSATNDSYTLSNLRFGWDRRSESMLISPFVGINNLFDETYNANVRINAFGGRFYEPGPDRNIYAGVTLRFDR